MTFRELTLPCGGGSRPSLGASLHDGKGSSGILPFSVVARGYLPLLGRSERQTGICSSLFVELALEKFLASG